MGEVATEIMVWALFPLLFACRQTQDGNQNKYREDGVLGGWGHELLMYHTATGRPEMLVQQKATHAIKQTAYSCP